MNQPVASYWQRPASARLDQQRRAIIRRGARVVPSWKQQSEVKA